jgi:hypothetical protein
MMKRETTAEALAAIRDQLHEISNALNVMNMRVQVLWEERKRKGRFGEDDDATLQES